MCERARYATLAGGMVDLHGPQVAVIAHAAGDTNGVLVAAWRRLGLDARLLTPAESVRILAAGDTALVRIDVRRSLDGIESGFGEVTTLARRGCRILNSPKSLEVVHDKLYTSRVLEAAEVAHPRTAHIRAGDEDLPLALPVVVKPRFGSWGRDVFRCETRLQYRECLRQIKDRPWFRATGALVQEYVPARGFDLRLLVAGNRVVGSARRIAAAGNWRTNVSLGGHLVPTIADPAARALGVRAALASGIDLVAIDLLPTAQGWTVLELNGAADFNDVYTALRSDVFAQVARSLGLAGATRAARLPAIRKESVR